MVIDINSKRYARIVLISISLAILALIVNHEVVAQTEQDQYSPYSGINYPENLYWGDTHVHTNLSLDAYTFGNRLDPDVAYNFAKGRSVESSNGQLVRLKKPLDFIVLADHAEFMGVYKLLGDKDADFLSTNVGKSWSVLYELGLYKDIMGQFSEVIKGRNTNDYVYSDRFIKSVWHDVISSAERNNEPGKFTAFIGFEWTSVDNGNNLHRNIIFRDGADRADKIIPFSILDSFDPEHLWDYLEDYEELTGGRVLAIPHNGNLSNGAMFSNTTFSGKALDRNYSMRRSRWEPLYEVTQIKGDAESHPILSPSDEFSDYEKWDWSNMDHTQPPKENWMLKHEYARSALKLGIEFENKLGANPFKFGLIGSSDSHTSLAAIEEDNFFGKFGQDEPSKKRMGIQQYYLAAKKHAASGYAAVWANENTRQSLFDAMLRRETYATTGPRIILRFFAGWDFEASDHLRPDYVDIGYKKGVPMGGDISMAPAGKVPSLLIVASKDPDGANLERVQVVKGWLDAQGEAQEKIWDVAMSDNRLPGADGVMAPPIRSTVDIKSATYSNSVGSAVLSTVWQDTEFDASQRAFYYVRVLEIFTPRWTTYDAAFYGVNLPDGVPPIHQERAYTSPVWYTP